MDRVRGSTPVSRTHRVQWGVTLLVIAVCAVVLANAELLGIAADLTPEERFSLSDATYALLDDIDDPLEIRYYVSDRLREISDEPQRKEALLRRYSDAGGADVRVEVVSAAGEGAREAEEAGLRAEQIQQENGDSIGVSTVYSGLTVSYLDRTRTIPFLFGHSQLEYQLSNAIYDVLRAARPRLAVMLGTHGEELDVDYAELVDELSDRFQLVELSGEQPEIPPDIDAVLLLGARDLTGAQSQELRRYFDGGGRALLAVDGLRIDLSTFEGEPVENEALDVLLASVGFRVEPYAVMDERSNPISDGTAPGGPPYPPWIRTDSRNASPDHPVTRFSAGIDFFWPSPLRIDGFDNGRGGPLLVTTPGAWLQGEPMRFRPDEPSVLYRDRDASVGSYALAGWSEDAAGEGSRAIVVGDSDFASNLVFYTGSFQNYMFVERSILWLLGEDRMAAVHTRSRLPGALDRIEPEFPRLLTSRIVESLNAVVLPVMLLLVGYLRLRRRRKIDQGERA